MKKIVFITIIFKLIFTIYTCDTPTESMGQTYPLIKFEIPKTTYLKVTVNNLVGDHLKTLAEKEFRAGSHHVQWDGKNSKGDFVKEGFYHLCIYQIDGKLWRSNLVYYEK